MRPHVRHYPLLALDQTIQRLETAWYAPPVDTEWYGYHPLPMPEFLNGLQACGEPTSFISLGCGIGTKLLVAWYMGWEVAGVEHDPALADAARKLVPEATITTADAFDVDVTQYDVVYAYRNCVDLEVQHRWNAELVRRMRPGSIYFCAGSDPVGLEPIDAAAGVWRV